jgi:hypothetical protein
MKATIEYCRLSRCAETGKDYGIYSWTITGHIVQCYENGSTVVHRPIPASQVGAA